MKELRGRNAIITGASRGLGVSIALALARQGINLVLAARTADALEEVRQQLLAYNVKAVAIPTDLSDATQVEALVPKAERELGSVDILINNAGIELTVPYERYPAEKIRLAVKVNLLAPMLLTHAVLPGMIKRGRGHIINMASLAGKIGFPYQTPYATTKAGLIMFTHSLRAEFIDKPIGASVICPGFVADSGMYARRNKTSVDAPMALKPTTTAKVVAAVIRAIRQDIAEITVNPLPTRPLTILREIATGSTPFIHKITGNIDFARKMQQKGS